MPIDEARPHDEVVAELRAALDRLDEAQRVGRMGSYDWHIPSDTNTWSDQLYRIYGTEPQSFNASYERFMGFIHPDDREKVQAVHMAAFKDHLPYHMEERIVRPTGEVRILDSTGEVEVDEDGNPVRMYGICRDITEQRRAEDAARRHAERFEALVESSPDALLVVNSDGVIVQVNKRTEAVFGYATSELIGQGVEVLLPAGLVDSVQSVRHRDGHDVPVDISLGELHTDEGMIVAAFVRDISERKRAEDFALRLHDAGVRRRHALEINDNVVQG
jgi:PAS domain S-box-containing protein